MRIRRGGETVGGGELVEVDGAHRAGGIAIAEDSVDGFRREHLAGGLGIGLGKLEDFDVGEEEELVVLDGTADQSAELVEHQVVARRGAVQVVEIGVGVERLVAVLFEQAAVPGVGAGAGDHLDLHGAFGVAIGAGGGGGDGHLLDGIGAREDGVEEAVAALVGVVLNVDAVERDVQGALRQTVDRRAARHAGSGAARLGDDQLGEVAAGEGQFVKLAADQGGGDGGALGLQDIGAAGDLDGFGERADFEPGVGGGRNAGIDLHVLDGDGLEAGVTDGDGVERGRQGRQDPQALVVGHEG